MINYPQFLIRLYDMGLTVHRYINEYDSRYYYEFSHLGSSKILWTIVLTDDFVYYEGLVISIKEIIQQMIDP